MPIKIIKRPFLPTSLCKRLTAPKCPQNCGKVVKSVSAVHTHIHTHILFLPLSLSLLTLASSFCFFGGHKKTNKPIFLVKRNDRGSRLLFNGGRRRLVKSLLLLINGFVWRADPQLLMIESFNQRGIPSHSLSIRRLFISTTINTINNAQYLWLALF